MSSDKGQESPKKIPVEKQIADLMIKLHPIVNELDDRYGVKPTFDTKLASGLRVRMVYDPNTEALVFRELFTNRSERPMGGVKLAGKALYPKDKWTEDYRNIQAVDGYYSTPNAQGIPREEIFRILQQAVPVWERLLDTTEKASLVLSGVNAETVEVK